MSGLEKKESSFHEDLHSSTLREACPGRSANKPLPSSDSLQVLAPFLRLESFHACPRSPVFPSHKQGAVRFSFSGVTFYFWPKCYCLFLKQKKKKKKMGGGMFFINLFL